MRRTLSLLSLIALAPLANAHEGHGVAMNSLMHYFSGPHLLAVLAVAAVVGSLWFLQTRRRSSIDK